MNEAMSLCSHLELVPVYAIRAMPAADLPAFEVHLASCESCRHELEDLRPVVDAFVAWPADVLRSSAPLYDRLASRIPAERGGDAVLPPPSGYREPEWEEVAPGIFCKLLANDAERNRVSMLVRLARAPNTLHTRMQASRSCTSSTVSCGSTTASSRGLQPRRAGDRRQACVERDRLHVRADDQHKRRPRLTRAGASSSVRPGNRTQATPATTAQVRFHAR